ncbi:MAG: hypothetical protein LKF31_03875 [Muribaculaceae bacterium]|jgi:hypothetical protein|nr:hypothetical protein [Muribaculaceae bacterium]
MENITKDLKAKHNSALRISATAVLVIGIIMALYFVVISFASSEIGFIGIVTGIGVVLLTLSIWAIFNVLVDMAENMESNLIPFAYEPSTTGEVYLHNEKVNYLAMRDDDGIAYVVLDDGSQCRIKTFRGVLNCFSMDSKGEYTIASNNLEEAIFKACS